ncbi:MAG: glycoside hydrolase family 9 protein, partial [Bacteroidota bacterium]|nr:glycoside hydrolase family 9 protein [Bacteroidota bacterium]
MKSLFLSLMLYVFTVLPLAAQNAPGSIRLNQLGYFPEAPKVAIIVSDGTLVKFNILKTEKSETVFTGSLSAQRPAELSDKITQIADFSSLKETGSFVLEVPGLGVSYPFEIKPKVYEALVKAAAKSYYFQRASYPMNEKFAGKWKRPAGHPDTKVRVHASATTKQRPEGTFISAPKGWYDAGDYNKYIVNSGITMGTLMSVYEDFPGYIKKLKLDIPESKNKLPDLLDEVLWNLRWMQAMQDPHDGGVYHKLTNPNFDDLAVWPHEATEDRYVVKKTTAAALNFAAVMAQAGRIFRDYNNINPGLADSCIIAAEKAWDWAKKNPKVLYLQEEMNLDHSPKITTGAYGDDNLQDEFIWAAIELYVTTKKDSYYKLLDFFQERNLQVPSWNQVRALGYYTLVRHEKQLSPIAKQGMGEAKRQIVNLADDLTKNVFFRSYQTVMGSSVQHYIWGSNAVAANQGIALIQAFKITSNKEYLAHALGNLDYLLGRNATGYSFVTGFGNKTPKNPHHRPS